MPTIELPTNPKGWLVVLFGSVVGFVAGTLATAWAAKAIR